MVFITNHQPTEVLQPGKQSFDLPTTLVAPKCSAILRRWLATISFVRCNQFHAVRFGQLLVKLIAVIRFVTDHFFRQIVQHASIQRSLHQRYFMWAGTARVYGERKTFSVAKAHDFGAFAAFGLAHAVAPFFAGANVPSMNPSLRSMPPRWRRSSANAVRIVSKTPWRVHCWNRRWHVLRGGYRSGKSFQGAPVRRIHKMPLRIARASWGGRPERPGPAFEAGTSSAIRCHCSFVRSISHRSDRLKQTL